MFAHGERRARPPRQALPVVTVPTLAATGSEMNDGAVLTNLATKEKSYVTAPCLYPAVAVVDPELTVTVPPDHTAYGAVDAITHALEGYFNGVDDTPVQDRMAQGVIEAIVDTAPIAIANGADISARANLQWASIVALNGWLQAGTAAGFPIHFIEHVISAHTDVAHGAGLAVLGLGWMRVAYHDCPNKYAELARRVFAINELEDDSAAQQLPAAYGMFLEEIGAPTHLHQLGIHEEQFELIADDTLKVYGRKGRIPGRPSLDRNGILDLLHHCL
jgi:alcohol dehydrogenase YqhD (iron-dependent ADH family)